MFPHTHHVHECRAKFGLLMGFLLYNHSTLEEEQLKETIKSIAMTFTPMMSLYTTVV